jgi:hypothetical protein
VRRVRGHRPTPWVDPSGDRYQRLVFSAPDVEQIAMQICASGEPIIVRRVTPGSLPQGSKDISSLAVADMKREDQQGDEC